MAKGGRKRSPKVPASADVSPRVAAARLALKQFLVSNQSSGVSVTEIDGPDGKKILVVSKPWGDLSVLLLIPDDIVAFAATLNNLILPQRYSAIWHRDTKSLEILWTAFRAPSFLDDVTNRKFKFTFRHKEYACEFSRASESVLTLARAFQSGASSDTQYRNLPAFNIYVTKQPQALQSLLGDPLCFWIKDIDWDEDTILALRLHLNFYLNYFDIRSPLITMHSASPPTATKERIRYIANEFPKKITSADIDPNVLFLWEAASKGEITTRFLYYYRVIEYSSVVYMDSAARSALRIALSLPNALDDLAAATESVVAAVQKMKMDEFARYDAMLRELVDPKLLWREINENLAAFTQDTQFEGGFKVHALLTPNRTEADFIQSDVLAFGRAIRDMRNALSHGRDQKTGTTISPTTHNIALLSPWIGPTSIVAAQVIMYKDVF